MKIKAIKLEKFMELQIDKNLFENQFKFISISTDITNEPNLFYGININNTKYKMIGKLKEFDEFDIVVRLVKWDWFNKNENYTIRIIKTNKNDKIDFKKEMEYLRNIII